MSEITRNAFLGGKVQIAQPRTGYRAGADPVFLAAAVVAEDGARVLELGAGVGTAMVCLAARVPGVHVTGVELQAGYAALARENLIANGSRGRVIVGDVRALPPDITEQSFDHVMTNPPFFDRSAGSAALHPDRETARGLEGGLSTWIDSGIRRLKPGGSFTLIHRVAALPACLGAIGDRLGDIRVLPLLPRSGREAKLFVLKAKKGRKGEFAIAPPRLLHKGDRHRDNGESYTDWAQGILRDGAALMF